MALVPGPSSKFAMGKPLGFGAYATVYSACIPSSSPEPDASPEQNRVAVKLAIRPEFSSILAREWNIGKLLHGTHLNQFLSFGTTEANLDYIIEPILGPSLENCMKVVGGRLQLSAALLIALRLLVPLEQFHAAGLVHCDVKPVCSFFCSIFSVISSFSNRTTSYSEVRIILKAI
jgi:serine/threonine protein kinase